MAENRESIIRIADDWLEKNRKTEAWKIINMLRDELVRDTDRRNS